jgi:hypothetical protein
MAVNESPAPSPTLQQIYRDGLVHFPGLLLCLAATVLLTKVSSLLAPFNLYFTFADLLKSGEGGYGLLPFFVKMLIPFMVGATYFHFAKARDASLEPTARRPLINLELTAGAGAALGALLLSWPAIVLWELVVSPTIYLYRLQFFIVYVLYIVSFWWIACAGVLAARLVWTQHAQREEIQMYCSPVLRHSAELIQAANFRSAVVF